jgi:hypothetical protein
VRSSVARKNGARARRSRAASRRSAGMLAFCSRRPHHDTRRHCREDGGSGRVACSCRHRVRRRRATPLQRLRHRAHGSKLCCCRCCRSCRCWRHQPRRSEEHATRRRYWGQQRRSGGSCW